MGYTTEFEGAFTLQPPANAEQVAYINKLANTRRMRRDVEKLKELFKGEHGLDGDYGQEGEYFVGGLGMMGQGNDDSIIEYNYPPRSQPGLWLKWEISEDGKLLSWNECEKFYRYLDWLDYLIIHFFEKWGIVLNGSVSYQGEDDNDKGIIRIVNNKRIDSLSYGLGSSDKTIKIESNRDLLNLLLTLSEEQLAERPLVATEVFVSTIEEAEIVEEDHINPSGEISEPISLYQEGGEFYDPDLDLESEPITVKKGTVVLYLPEH